MSGNQRAGRIPVCTVFYLGNGCADAGPLLPCYACRKSVQGGHNGRPARLPRDIAQLYRSGYDFLCAAVWAAGALDRSDHVPVAPRTRKSFHPHGNICPRAAVHAPFPAGAGASSGAAGSACVTSVAGVKLSACASVSVGAVHGRRPRAAVHTPFPVGAGASSGAAGSACANSVAGVKLSACASVSVGAVASGGTAAVHAPRFMRRSR